MSDVTEHFQTPPTTELFQQDEEPVSAIPVVVKGGQVTVDRLPGELSALRYWVLAKGADPIPILPRDPRRKRAVMWSIYMGTQAANTIVAPLLAVSKSGCSGLDGAPMISYNDVHPWTLETSSEVWARGVDIVANGNLYQSMVPTQNNDILVMLAIENWSR